jgi:MYXO-CTERM domain-containing protein
MRIKLLVLVCLFASAQFLRAKAIASCFNGYPVYADQQTAYGNTEAQVNCQLASASVSFSLVGLGPVYQNVALVSVGGATHADNGGFASLQLPLVVLGGPPQGRLLIRFHSLVDYFSVASNAYASAQVGDWGFTAYGPGDPSGLVDYTRGQPIDLLITASGGACPTCFGGVGGFSASMLIGEIDILNAGADTLAEGAQIEVVPEPGCLWLGAAGLCALGVLRRRPDPSA